MSQIKVLIGIKKSLSNVLINLNNLESEVKQGWITYTEYLIKSINEAIEYEKTINKQ